ncbi:MAG: TetR/AcrR family transcriptional regulator C-terminal domain-containing protein [Actinomycetota bacterium]
MPDTSRRLGLTRADVVREAAVIVRRDGLDGLTMRKLADALDVWPRTIYHHAGGGREVICDLVVETVLAGIERPSTELAWRDQIREIADGLRDALHAHPGTADRMLSHGSPLTPDVLWIPDLVQSILVAEGLSVLDAACAWSLLSSHVCQHVIIELRWTSAATGRGTMSAHEYDEYLERVRAATADLPTLRQSLELSVDASYDRVFTFGLDMLLTGFASLTEPTATAAS